MDVLFKTILLFVLTTMPLYAQGLSDTLQPSETPTRTLEYYESFLEKHPEVAEARFGAGFSAYNMEDYQRALSEFGAALNSEDQALQSKTHYNLGNTLYQEERYEESLSAFRKALELNPEDFDAKYNYELIRQIIQQKQNRQNPSSQKKQENRQSDQEEEQGESKQDEQQEQPTDDKQEQETGMEQNQEKKEQQNSQSASEKNKNQKPDAESILNALRADEENLMKRQLGVAQSKKLEKDW